ncbi:recombinase family protein [Streptomyces sp. TRM66268-LWL]|uniref:Recombinase family protein n=1 Tax=Streptomyces polyasparticus TaxID=2767826 RepID=A0ABR7SV68_9ACTN|nr:recombinase family protein [Streptomyces polyasparticus]MBC9719404.1 recombinase family protein [Streptomyces polyasparticus]
MNQRVLGSLRLSVETDDSTAIPRQRDHIQHWVDAPGREAEIIGWATDTDVSGGLHPFKRPDLGKWFTDDYKDRWDVLGVMKIDRLSRRVAHFSEVVQWCQQHGKVIVSTQEGIDMSTPMGKMFAQILAVFAEGELDTIRARARDAVQTRLAAGAWVAGLAPFGYEFVQVGKGKGKRLQPLDHYKELAEEIAAKVLDGQSLRSISRDLEGRGEPTWLSLIQPNSKRAQLSRWSNSSIRGVLLNPKIAGLYTYKGEIVEDDEGNPRMIADEPLLDMGTWHRVVMRLRDNRSFGGQVTKSRAMLVGVAACGGCGGPLTKAQFTNRYPAVGDRPARENHYSRYKCSKHAVHGSCPRAAAVNTSDLEGEFTRLFLEHMGHLPEVRELESNLYDPSHDITATRARLDRLKADFAAGKYDGEEKEEIYWSLLNSQTAKLSRLRVLHAEYERSKGKFAATGRTFADIWNSRDDEGKQLFLKEHRVKILVYRDPLPDKKFGFLMQLGDVTRMARAAHVEVPDDLAHGVITFNLPTKEHLRDRSLDARQVRIGLDVIDSIEAALRMAAEENERSRMGGHTLPAARSKTNTTDEHQQQVSGDDQAHA